MTTLSLVRQQPVFPWGVTSALFIWDLISDETEMTNNAEPLQAVHLRATSGGSR